MLILPKINKVANMKNKYDLLH